MRGAAEGSNIFINFNMVLILEHFVGFETLLSEGSKIICQSIRNYVYNNLILTFKWSISLIFEEKMDRE